MSERALGPLEEIEDGGARGYPAAPGGFTGLFAVRRGLDVWVYVNACPHVGLPLEMQPNRFLDGRKEKIVCTAHGARFRIEDGVCIAGPCLGDELEAVAHQLDADGVIWVPESAGR
ncbi:Rieske (2Fe-2S) protein [Humitalea sp. 24SJ18S-53]|uniref:Rieske (2Fe-2S) protein n=1 Tax=Humitalea sp. 24SJ18S-53 TaxID=3422307 RepID=UPI003D67E400